MDSSQRQMCTKLPLPTSQRVSINGSTKFPFPLPHSPPLQPPPISEQLQEGCPTIQPSQKASNGSKARSRVRRTMKIIVALGVGGAAALIMNQYNPSRRDVFRTPSCRNEIPKAVRWLISHAAAILPASVGYRQSDELSQNCFKDNVIVSLQRLKLC